MDDNLRQAALTLWNEQVADLAERTNITKSRAIYLAMRDPIGRRLWALAKQAIDPIAQRHTAESSGGPRAEVTT